MPANLTPEYIKAEEWFRKATTNDEKILALEQMLRVIPKHKGTDHMRADLRRKLSKLKEAATVKKGGGTHVDIFYVPKSGSGQVVLIGTPNSGKSAIVGALTNAKVHVAEFPFATALATPGMAKFEDVPIQLVDMPPITAEFSAPGQVGTYRNCNLVAIVIDLAGDASEQMRVCLEFLDSHRLLRDDQTPSLDAHGNVLGKNVLVICTKSDIAEADAFDKFQRQCDRGFGFIEISIESGKNVDKLCAKLFEMLNIIRIYAKPPGKPADMTDPFTLGKGSTVMDLAQSIHRQLAEKLKFARAWGSGVHDGQNVHLTHELHDKDIIELHFS